ncbi:MAG: HupE/UreJ family protein [Bacteroidota bacterium]
MDCFSGFDLYFPMGLEHILDPNGYDHILFVVALAVMYQLKEWKRVLILVTAFTIGHSITLALSALNIYTIDQEIAEFWIPITILVTALINVFFSLRDKELKQSHTFSYLLALLFGFIHGMGFSYLFRAMSAKEACLTGPLLYFNLGIEAGQLVIVGVVLILTFVLVNWIKLPHRIWKLVISAIIAVLAVMLMLG